MMQRSIFSLAFLTLALVTTLPGDSHAQEAKAIPAASTEAVEAKSEKANTEASPAKEAAETAGDAAVDSEGKKTTSDQAEAKEEAPARALTEEEKKTAISEADAITSYDAEKVRGMAKPWQHYYQPPASPVMKHLEKLHDGIFVIITIITLVVLALLIYICLRFRAGKNPNPRRFAHNTTVEIVWTLVPILILIGIGIPSVRAHYQYTNNQDIIDNPDVTLKVVGHQWYWSYEYPDYGIAFDSNIVPEKDLKNGQPRLLTVDNPIVVPVGKVVRLQLTSADVIHDFALPSMGVKQDTVPGKLNETWFKAEHEGIYYGQCSELCGKYHGFMPIELHVVSEPMFEAWVTGAKLKYANDNHIQLALNN
jgi:cytochrome c oxidase subunit 2